MGELLIPRATVEYVYDVTWPAPANYDTSTPGAITTNAAGRWAQQNLSAFSQVIGAGAPVMGLRSEQIGANFPVGSGRICNSLAFFPALSPTLQTSAAFRQPEPWRVCRVQFLFAMPTNMGVDGGFSIIPGNKNGTVSYPSGAGASSGFGVQGDGAGGLQWFAKQTVAGGFLDVTPIAWPVPVTELVLVEMEIANSGGGAAASFRLFLNGARVALPATSSSWAAGTTLPSYDLGGGNLANRLCFGVNVGVAGSLFIGTTRWMAGRFTIEGNELFNANGGSI